MKLEIGNMKLRTAGYDLEQGVSEEEALNRGVEAKSPEFVEKGAEVHAKA